MSIVINREEFGIYLFSEWTIGLRGIAEQEAEAEKFMKK